MPKVTVFDVGSSFGYFRKGFTTTNALTHSVIPRSAVEGLVGAIIGLPRNQFPKDLQYNKIAVEIMSPVRKLNMKYMHTNPEWWQNVSHYLLKKKTSREEIKPKQFAIPVSVEFLVDPRYRIYIDDEKINEKLSKYLMDRQSHYTPFLGTSSMICSVKYVGKHDYKRVSSKDYVPVRSIIPFSEKIPKIKVERDLKFAIEEGLTIHLDVQRTPHGTYKVLYSPEIGQLQIIDDDLIELHIEDRTSYVKFLPTQISSQQAAA